MAVDYLAALHNKARTRYTVVTRTGATMMTDKTAKPAAKAEFAAANDTGPVLDIRTSRMLQNRTTMRLPSGDVPLFHARRA
jgi:hypothetical protein